MLKITKKQVVVKTFKDLEVGTIYEDVNGQVCIKISSVSNEENCFNLSAKALESEFPTARVIPYPDAELIV